ncbi:MAG: UDP-N-acetylmuramate--L-alanine ligase [Lachnospiraceae bacterium]|nr:UDP-N-acetylmuramate--L-alanine ligase [Lachnospiraceae bacterium]
MYNIDFNNPVKVHFMGIGGISMSGLALILRQRGFSVQGSDRSRSEITDMLEDAGISIKYVQEAENITPDIDCIVYTAAIHRDNPEFAAAEASGIPMLTRAELLGQIMSHYRDSIAVSGTHGKTTTTSMISVILMEAGKDPTVTLGGVLDEIGGNIRMGTSESFVAEACEYTNSFLCLSPRIGLILNVDMDHVDFFKDTDDYRNSFRDFARKIPEDGLLVINGDIEDIDYFTDGVRCKVVTYGEGPDNDYRASDITYDEKVHATYQLLIKGVPSGSFTLNVPGRHNVINSLAALAAADFLGVDRASEAAGLLRFGGTERRFEYKGSFNGVTVIDDYAHHPTEIEATLTTAKMAAKGKMWCVFQPHTYTRTKAFLKEFADALSIADTIVLTHIYAAREQNTVGVSAGDICNILCEKGREAYYIPEFEDVENFFKEKCSPGDMLITVGAGNVVEIGEHLVQK